MLKIDFEALFLIVRFQNNKSESINEVEKLITLINLVILAIIMSKNDLHKIWILNFRF